MKVKYIDSICTNTKHLGFNVSLLAMFSRLCSSITYYGQEKNLKDIITLTNENNIHINNLNKKKLYLPDEKSGITAALVFFISFFYNIFLVIFSKKGEVLIFNYNNLLSIRIINFLNKFLNRNILIFCHGEMEFLTCDMNKHGPLSRLLAFFCKNFFLNKNIKVSDKIFFFVIGESILNNIKNVVSQNISKNFLSLDHSYLFKKNTTITIREKNSKLNLGTVGIFSKIKGADDFCKLCNLLNKDKFNLSISGKIFYDINVLSSMGVNLPKNNGKYTLMREELEERVENLDFIIYLYPNDSYKLMASGAILDSINMKKPIISLKNDYFSYLFNKFGHFGYLFSSVEEMAFFLNNLNIDISSSFDFDLIQKKLSIENISKDLEKQLHLINLFK